MTRALLLFLAALLSGSAVATGTYMERPEVKRFIAEMVERHGFVEDELQYLFAGAQRAEPVLAAISAPREKSRSWEEYRATFLTERRIAAGAEFRRKHRRALERAERRYGVPAEYIAAIIGVETFYGRNTGQWRVADALVTLAFDYAPRAPFFRRELEHYLLLTRDARVNVFSVRGSYAGAIGIPQFMPSSTRRYAVDFDGNGAIDLRRSPADAIGSVANFLREHGWQPGAEVLLQARVTGEAWRAFVGIEPKHPLDTLRQAGIEFSSAADSYGTLVELETPERASDYRVGLQNFYVLTRYNRSAFYASAVHDLAQELKNRGQSPISER